MIFVNTDENSCAPGSPLTPARFRIMVALFLVSGAAGLVDQICFAKYLSYVVGATAYAVSAVLAAFMTGLTLGAAIGGRLSSRMRRPLVAYGAAELVVGAAVALTPLAFAALTPLYVGLARATHGSLALVVAARWAVAMLVVVVPTIAMGTTLPLISAALGPRDSGSAKPLAERRLGALYAANTFGGALGALLGAYAVLPALGLSKTVFAAAAVSASAGIVSIALGLRSVEAASASSITANDPAYAEIPGQSSGFGDRWIAGLAFASGALVFMMEVIATHLLAVIVGNSVYAFGLILAAFLCCLFLGAALAPRLAERFGGAALAVSLGLTSLALAVTLPLWDDLPLLFAGLNESLKTFAEREGMRGLVAFGILSLPATCMGLTFPLLLRWAAQTTDVGRLVGRLTAVNTVGAVSGALAAGYVALPRLGSERSLRLVLFAFVALALGTALRRGAAEWRPAGLAGVAALLALVLPRWDLAHLTTGANVYFDWAEPIDELLSVQEDVHGGVTTVARRGATRTLYTNGKFLGTDSLEARAQQYFAHYPCLFVSHFGEALVIGLGTGATAGTLAAYPWQHIDVAEISSAVAVAARAHFSGINRHVLDDPRVRLVVDDARNHLLVTQAQYDLIGMELTSVWFAGAATLYSSEYYRLVREHLTQGGIFQQWVQLHHMTRPVFATLVNTLHREFPHVALFYGGQQGILVASMQPLVLSEIRIRELSGRPGVQETLPDGRKLVDLLDDVLLLDASLDRYLADSATLAGVPLRAMVSTDDNLFLEYATPKGNVLGWTERQVLVGHIGTYRDPGAILGLLSVEAALP
jgi:spermidine synthase